MQRHWLIATDGELSDYGKQISKNIVASNDDVSLIDVSNLIDIQSSMENIEVEATIAITDSSDYICGVLGVISGHGNSPLLIVATGDSYKKMQALFSDHPLVHGIFGNSDMADAYNLADHAAKLFTDEHKNGGELIKLAERNRELRSMNSLLASQSAKVVKLKREQEYHRRKMESLVEFGREINTLSMRELSTILSTRLPYIFGIEKFTIFAVVEDMLSLIATNIQELLDEEEPLVIRAEESPIMAATVKCAESIFTHEFSASSYKISDKQNEYLDDFAICIPIISEQVVVGILNMSGNHKGVFDDTNLAFIKLGVELLSSAISNAMKHNLIQQMASTDPLTGLHNNRFFFAELEEEWEKQGRYGREFAIVMCDIDLFKQVNDSYGHQAGDFILKRFASLLASTARKVDVVARYGGEEFVILLPETSKKDAAMVAERIRQELENTVHKFDTNEIKITASFGVSDTLDKDVSSSKVLLKVADSRLYIAKDSGRNLVIKEG